jgi:hypothetical protein
MVKKILYISLLTITFGCTQNVWITQTVLRPNKPKFSILKEPFQGHSLINNKYIYVLTELPINYDSNAIVATYGFYPDGRVIANSFDKANIDSLIFDRVSWDSSACIGYYTTKGNVIKFQYFEQYGGGEYINQEGMIRPDTIILIDKLRGILGKITTRYDTLIKSIYQLQ